MSYTTPNKEVIRRICHLHGATECYLLLEACNKYIDILTDIPNEKLLECKSDLKSWTGMEFKVYNYNDGKAVINKIQSKENRILPIVL